MDRLRLAAYIKRFATKRNLRFRHVCYGFLIIVALLVSSARLAGLTPYQAPEHFQYFRAQVISVQMTQSDQGSDQNIKARIIDGPDKNRVVLVSRSVNFGDASYKRLPVGSDILLTKDSGNGNQYQYGDRWHMPGVVTLFLIVLALVILVGWWRGITSLIGLVISIAVLALYVVPRIIAGEPAYATCIQAAFFITVISVFVAHGFSRRTTIAFVGSVVTLLVIIGVVAIATYLTGTSEVVDEQTFAVLYAQHPISLADLLTGGVVIASLGVIYDITTGQAAAVDEIYKADKKQSALTLFFKGLSVGREHIAALINTLALVYAGIALPTIIITALYNHAPLVVALNDESVIEEVVRTIVACIGTLLAVPITTGLAAYLLPKWYQVNNRQLLGHIQTILSRK